MPLSSMRFIIIMLALSFATVAEGQVGDWYVAPSIAFINDAAYRAVDDSVAGLQVTVGRNMTEHVSLEGLLGYADINAYCDPVDCYRDQEHLEIGANLLAFLNRDNAFTPYLLIGVGYLDVGLEEGTQFARDSGDSGATASGGLGFRWRMGQSKFSIQAEYRARAVFGTKTLTDQLATVGLQYNFGGSQPVLSAPESNEDTDGDGVLDIWDACPNTPPGTDVTSRGCELRNIDTDGDGDRVFDSKDECPNTPFGVPVDPRGCSLDSDMDGVTSDKDRCPASRAGAEVNIYGCEVDQDEDGVPDHRDDCLFTRAGVRVDVKGCEIRDIISLPGVNFETGHDILVAGTEYLLQEAAATLKIHLDLQIEVAGHTDDVGNENLNQGLSMRRAKTVRDFLISYGVDEDRLSFRGYGETQPIADNSTADGRATNRRVELRLVTQ